MAGEQGQSQRGRLCGFIGRWKRLVRGGKKESLLCLVAKSYGGEEGVNSKTSPMRKEQAVMAMLRSAGKPMRSSRQGASCKVCQVMRESMKLGIEKNA